MSDLKLDALIMPINALSASYAAAGGYVPIIAQYSEISAQSGFSRLDTLSRLSLWEYRTMENHLAFALWGTGGVNRP